MTSRTTRTTATDLMLRVWDADAVAWRDAHVTLPGEPPPCFAEQLAARMVCIGASGFSPGHVGLPVPDGWPALTHDTLLVATRAVRTPPSPGAPTPAALLAALEAEYGCTPAGRRLDALLDALATIDTTFALPLSRADIEIEHLDRVAGSGHGLERLGPYAILQQRGAGDALLVTCTETAAEAVELIGVRLGNEDNGQTLSLLVDLSGPVAAVHHVKVQTVLGAPLDRPVPARAGTRHASQGRDTAAPDGPRV